jgi:ATP-binding cassette subfamily B protein
MWESLRTVRKYLWRYRRGMALGVLCLILKDLAQVSQPLMIGRAVDSLSAAGSGRAATLFFRYVGYLLGFALLKAVFQFGMRVILIGISRDVEYDLRNDLFQHLPVRALETSWRGRPTT